LSALPQPAARDARPDVPGGVRALEERLAALRACGRALRSIVGATEVPPVERRLEDLASSLGDLAEQVQSATLGGAAALPGEADSLHAELARLGSGLAAVAGELRAALDRAPLPEIRGRLPHATGPERDDQLALLDLLIEDESGLAARHGLVDLLVTRLATETRSGRRRVAHDPAALTPRLDAVAKRLAGRAEPDPGTLEREFVEAARRLGSEPLADALRRMRARKAAIGLAWLAPPVLRAIVFYNVSVWNHVQDSRSERPAEEAPSSPARAASAASPAPAPDAPLERAPVDLPPALAPPAAWQIDPRAVAPPPPPPARPHSPVSRRSFGRALRLVATSALVVLAARVWLVTPSGTVRPFPDSELETVSPWLASGYRSGSGSGPIFVGILDPTWHALTSHARRAKAAEITDLLVSAGVRDILLYDSRRRLVIQRGSGLPLRVAE